MSYSEGGYLTQFSISGFLELDSKKKEYSSSFSPQSLQIDDYPMLYSLQEIMEDCPEAETEIYGKILHYMKDLEEFMEKSQKINTKMKEWITFRLEKDNFEARLCKTSWPASFGRPLGGYEYVDVMVKDENDDEKQLRLIVDIDFRGQFELARPTQGYEELVNSLPVIFVGTEQKLKNLISLVSSAAKQSLTERGMYVPPWRKANYMLSKWLSNDCKKFSFKN